MNKIKFLLIIVCLGFITFYLSDYARSIVINSTNFVLSLYQDTRDFIIETIDEHFDQADEIRALREQNAELEHSATLLSAFAYKLDTLLSEQNSTRFNPDVKLVRAISYMNIGDHDKIWIDFDEFDENRIYGLISQGKTAGIVVNKDGNPLALLQTDPKSTFSVSIGEHENQTAGDNNTTHYENVTVEMTSNLNKNKTVELDAVQDSVDYNNQTLQNNTAYN